MLTVGALRMVIVCLCVIAVCERISEHAQGRGESCIAE